MSKKDPNTLHFDYSLFSKSVELDILVSDLAIKANLNREKQKNACRLILLNLALADGNKVAVSRDNKHKVASKYCQYDVNVTSIKTATDKLHSAKFINLDTGINAPDGKGRRSTIQTSEDLYLALSKIPLVMEIKELVQLRGDGENKGPSSLIDYDDTPRANRIRKQLQAYNKLLSSIAIEVRDSSGTKIIDLNNQHIYRKFIDNGEYDSQGRSLFNSGGRSYAAWSALNKTGARSLIFIDGEESVEEDYTASTINILYRAVTGTRFNGDPYDLTVGKLHVPRHLVKAVATCAQNCDSLNGVSRAVGKRYSDGKTSSDPQTIANYQEYKDFKKRVEIVAVLQSFLNKHQPIKHALLQGKHLGNKIQCLESDLVFEVVNQLTQQGIPCLTIHDSFIVQEKHQQILKTLMDTTDFPDRSLVDNLA